MERVARPSQSSQAAVQWTATSLYEYWPTEIPVLTKDIKKVKKHYYFLEIKDREQMNSNSFVLCSVKTLNDGNGEQLATVPFQ